MVEGDKLKKNMTEEDIERTNSKTYSDVSILQKIWTEPRSVLRYINLAGHDKYVPLLLVLAGIVRSFDRARSNDVGQDKELVAIIGLSVLMGGLLGWLSFYLYSTLVSWTGKWLGGKADTSDILRMIAYGMIPSIFGLILLIPQIGIHGNDLFISDADLTSGSVLLDTLFYVFLFSEVALGILSMCLCIIGISEAQEFTTGKALLNALLPAIIIVLPLMLIGLLVGSL